MSNIYFLIFDDLFKLLKVYSAIIISITGFQQFLKLKKSPSSFRCQSFLHSQKYHIDLFDLWNLCNVAMRLSLWSPRLVRNVRFVLNLLFILKLLCIYSRVISLLWLLLEFVFSKIAQLILASFACSFDTDLFFWLKLSSWSMRCRWSRRLLRIKSNFNEFIKSRIGWKCKWNKVEKVIKIFISKNTVINTLELAVQINSSFKSSNLWPISIWANKPSYLYLSFLFHIQHVEQIINHGLTLQIHITLYPINQLCIINLPKFIRVVLADQFTHWFLGKILEIYSHFLCIY